VYAALEDVAEASGMTPADWIASRLATDAPPGEEPRDSSPPRTAADIFAGRVGRVRSGGKESLSENTGRKFGEYLEEKKRAGHL